MVSGRGLYQWCNPTSIFFGGCWMMFMCASGVFSLRVTKLCHVESSKSTMIIVLTPRIRLKYTSDPDDVWNNLVLNKLAQWKKSISDTLIALNYRPLNLWKRRQHTWRTNAYIPVANVWDTNAGRLRAVTPRRCQRYTNIVSNVQ